MTTEFQAGAPLPGSAELSRTNRLSAMLLGLSTVVAVPIGSGGAALLHWQLKPESYDYIWGWVIHALSLVVLALPAFVVAVSLTVKLHRRRRAGMGTARATRRLRMAWGLWSLLALFWVVSSFSVLLTELF